jgi:tRNA-splicing ligase RtcB
MLKASQKYGIELPDRQLCCAPIESDEGKQYLSAMACAINYAFANRQMITHLARESFENIFAIGSEKLKMRLIYDVCHNIAKIETHKINNQLKQVCVHRKGATRAFPPGHKDIPEDYREIGQPVIIPGDMGRCSYLLVGTEGSMQETFGSTCHGAGRLMSRKKAIRSAKGRSIGKELEEKGIVAMAPSWDSLAEEMPEAYKNVSDVVDIVHHVGISKKVAKLKPMGVIKG